MKYVSFITKFILIIVALGALGLAALWVNLFVDPRSLLPSENEGLSYKVYFLRDVEIVDEDHPILVFYEPAAGGELRAVDDPDLLRSRAEDSYYSVDPDPFRPPLSHSHRGEGYFAALFTDSELQDYWTCEVRFCSTSDTPGVAPEYSSLQPLLDASHPVTRVFESRHTLAAQRSFVDSVLQDPDVIAASIEARDPYFGTTDFGGAFRVSLPTVFVSTELSAPDRQRIAEAEMDRMTQQLTDRLNATGLNWKIDGDPALRGGQGPLFRQRGSDDKSNNAILGQDGEMIMMKSYEIFSPSVSIAGPKEMFDKLVSGGVQEIRTSRGLNNAVKDTLDHELSQATGEPFQGSWKLDIQYDITDRPIVSDFFPSIYQITYMRIQRDQ